MAKMPRMLGKLTKSSRRAITKASLGSAARDKGPVSQPVKYPVAKSSGDVHFGSSPSVSGRRPGAQPGNTNASKNHAPQNASGKTYSDARANQGRTGNRYPGSLGPSNFGRARPFPFGKK